MDRLQRLLDARDRLSGAIAECESMRDLPALVREYRAVLAEVDGLSGAAETDPVDELAEERKRRRSG